MSGLRRRVNPWCLGALALLGIVRGLTYISASMGGAYKLPHALDVIFDHGWQMAFAGAVWVAASLLFAVGVMFGRQLRWFTSAYVGVKLTWVALHLVALIQDFTLNTLLSVMIHVTLIMVLMTLVQVEITASAEEAANVE